MSENKGHRARLRERFMKAELRTLPDYEILEMLLYYAIPRADTKSIAKSLLTEFGSIAGVINASSQELLKVKGLGKVSEYFFKLLLDFHSRLFVPAIPKQWNVLNNWHAVLNYCRLTMGYKRKSEFFRVLYLNRKNHLIADEFHDHGTVDNIQIYPREIARKVIEFSASAVILIHNHPSGDPKPSKCDIEITEVITRVLEPMGAVVHDHLIIAGFDHFSFKAGKLL